MKKLFKNKKFMTGIISAMIGVSLLMVGLTYAWFTNSGANASDGITMGKIDVAATLDNNVYSVGEPGVNVINQIGYIQNNGSVSALAKLTLSATVTIKSDADGNPLDPSAYYTIENDPNVTIELQSDGYELGDVPALGLWIDGDNLYMWGTSNNDIYVAMDGNKKLPFAYTVKLSGEMGNAYMGADVKVAVNWQATQLLADGAIKDTFGIDDIMAQISWFDEIYDFQATVMPFSFGKGIQSNAARYAALTEKLPDCSFKTLLENVLAQQ